ncbi:hypothetical protein ACOME3_007716 [Neoechinorhynchus agilis]
MSNYLDFLFFSLPPLKLAVEFLSAAESIRGSRVSSSPESIFVLPTSAHVQSSWSGCLFLPFLFRGLYLNAPTVAIETQTTIRRRAFIREAKGRNAIEFIGPIYTFER